MLNHGVLQTKHKNKKPSVLQHSVWAIRMWYRFVIWLWFNFCHLMEIQNESSDGKTISILMVIKMKSSNGDEHWVIWWWYKSSYLMVIKFESSDGDTN